MTPETRNRVATLAALAIVSIAVTGYFVGLQSPMNPAAVTTQSAYSRQHDTTSQEGHSADHPESEMSALDTHADRVLPSTSYLAMQQTHRQRGRTRLVNLHAGSAGANPLIPETEIVITPDDKTEALAQRAQNRAYNGAPPTIPHPIDQFSDSACIACHENGMSTVTLRISRMSHPYLTNCTQCHVESNPQHMAPALFRSSQFVGIPAPTGGHRAYPGAPPMIPHSTWMRDNCTSCHGGAGLHGIRTTHPWRQNCRQCHLLAPGVDQVPLATEPKFLPPPTIDPQDT